MIPTAEEFLNTQDSYIKNKHVLLLGTGKIIQQNMIEFAKLHVKEALKAAKERCMTEADDILESYNLDNIK